MTRISPAIVLCALALGLSATIYAVRREAKPNFAPVAVAQADSVSTITRKVEITVRPLGSGATITQKSSFSAASKSISAIDMKWTGTKFLAKTAEGRTVFDFALGATRQSSKPQRFSIEIKNSVIEKMGFGQSITSQSRSGTVTVKRGTPVKELF